MADCEVFGCNGDDALSFSCNECEATFCSTHRLPESHSCPELQRTRSSGDQPFSSGLQEKKEKKSGLTRRDDTTKRRAESPLDRPGKSCTVCDTDSPIYSCNHCGDYLCPDHRLPRNHDCVHGRTGRTTDSTGESSTAESIAPSSEKRRGTSSDSESESTGEETPKPMGAPSPEVAKDGSIKGQSWSSQEDTRRNAGGVTKAFNWLKNFTYSVSITVVATIVAPFYVLWNHKLPLIVIGLVLVGGILVGPYDGAVKVPGGMDSTVDSSLESAASDVSEFATNVTEEEPLNQSKIEYEIHERIDKIRQNRGLSRLEFDRDLRKIARYHSRDMAANSYFAHTSPDGESMEDRYAKFGYNCRVATSGNRYATGGENIAYTYAFTDVVTDGGTEVHLGNETQIADGIVRQWMNSQGHRENILRPYWQNEGIGIDIIETENGTRVYATQNFC